MRIYYFIFFLLFSVAIQAQSSKKITDLLPDINTDCPLLTENIVKEKPKTNISEAAPPPPPPSPPASGNKKSIDREDKVITASTTKNLFSTLCKHLEKVEYTSIKNTTYGIFYQNDDMLWGLRSLDGEILCEPRFKIILPLKSDSIFAAMEKGSLQYCFYNTKGKQVSAECYDSMTYYENADYVKVAKGKHMGLTDTKGKIIYEPIFEEINGRRGNYAMFKEGDMYGIMDNTGKIIEPAVHKYIRYATTNDKSPIFIARSKNDKLLVIHAGKSVTELNIPYKANAEGRIYNQRYLNYNWKQIDLKEKKQVICEDKLSVAYFNKVPNLFRVQIDEKHYLINEKGDMVVDFPVSQKSRWDKFLFENGVLIVREKLEGKDERGRKKYRVGLLGDDLEWKLQPIYSDIQIVHKTPYFIAVTPDKKSKLLNITGEDMFSDDYVGVAKMADRILRIRSETSTVVEVYDRQLNKLFETDLKHGGIKRISDNFYEAIRFEDRTKVILNKNWQEIYTQDYSSLDSFGTDGLRVNNYVNREYQRKIIDLEGNPYPFVTKKLKGQKVTNASNIGKTEFYQIWTDAGNSFLYQSKDKEVYPISSGITVVGDGSFTYDLFHLGLLKVYSRTLKKSGLIDIRGQEVVPLIYNSINIWRANKNVIQFKKDGKITLVTKSGIELFKKYDHAYPLFDDYFVVRKNGKKGVINIDNKIIIPVKYKDIKRYEKTGSFHVINMDGSKEVIGPASVE